MPGHKCRIPTTTAVYSLLIRRRLPPTSWSIDGLQAPQLHQSADTLAVDLVSLPKKSRTLGATSMAHGINRATAGSWLASRNSWGVVNAEKNSGRPLKARGETGPTAMKENSRNSGRGALWGSRKD